MPLVPALLLHNTNLKPMEVGRAWYGICPHTVANVPSAHLLSDGEMLSRLLITRRPALDIGGDLLLAFLHPLPTLHMPRRPAGVAGDAVAAAVVVASEDTVAAAAAAADPAVAAAAAADASGL